MKVFYQSSFATVAGIENSDFEEARSATYREAAVFTISTYYHLLFEDHLLSKDHGGCINELLVFALPPIYGAR